MAKPLQVLLLEDRPADAELIIHELRRSGFDPQWKRVETEKEFREALATKLDIILADYTLPQFDALRALRCLQETSLDIPFIVVTGTISEEAAVECMQQGASDYLIKDRLTRLGPAVIHALEEANLQRREQATEIALQKSEALNQAILSSLNAHVAVLDCNGNIIAYNDAWERFARQNGDPDLQHCGLGKNYLAITRIAADEGSDEAAKALHGILSVLEGSQPLFSMEYAAHSPAAKRWFLLYVTPTAGPQAGVVTTHLEITQRKLAEERLTLLSTALEAAANTVMITDRAGTIVWVNPAFTKLTGYTFNQAVGHLSHLASSRTRDPKFYGEMWNTILSGKVWHSEILNRRRDGSTYTAEITITPVYDERGEISHFIDIENDITERKQHEREMEAIVLIANALRNAKTLSEMLPVIIDELLGLLKAETAAISLYDPSTDEMVISLARGAFAKSSGMRFPASEGLNGYLIATRKMYFATNILKDPRLEKGFIDVPYAAAGIALIAQGQVVGLLWVGRKTDLSQNDARVMAAIADIAASAIFRAGLYGETELRLQRLTALREVDKAISASLDLRATLSVLVEQVVAQLNIHAADVLLFNRESQSLEYAASHGFRYSYPPSASISGLSFAQQAVMDRTIQSVPDISKEQGEMASRLRLRGDEFTAYFAIPLIAKGQVKGVLELFNRTPHYPNNDWLNFLDTLARQAAIAIDNSELFNSLQSTNIKLSMAWDGTIEGWSRALDLRDHETEGHTQRVTEMTINLARAAGIRESDLVHIRRGALLHDIGKMAIPDTILLKKEPLTADDWATIRQHPNWAYELLAPIEFLRPALDIPYCHHERWDGSGYPRGLRAEQIPLAARVFSIIDVYDALTSDRVYREGWEKDRTLQYIREQAGKQFDPSLTELFLSGNWGRDNYPQEEPHATFALPRPGI